MTPDNSLDEEDQILKETLDDFMRELPIIVRTLGPDLYGEVERLLRDHPEKVASARPLLIEAAARLSQQTNTVARMLMRERPEFGRKILERKHDKSRWLIEAKRTQVGLPYPAWEILDDFQQVNRRLSGVAPTSIVAMNRRSKRWRPNARALPKTECAQSSPRLAQRRRDQRQCHADVGLRMLDPEPLSVVEGLFACQAPSAGAAHPVKHSRMARRQTRRSVRLRPRRNRSEWLLNLARANGSDATFSFGPIPAAWSAA